MTDSYTFTGSILTIKPTKTSFGMGEKVQFEVEGLTTLHRESINLWTTLQIWSTRWQVFNEKGVSVGYDDRKHTILYVTKQDQANDKFTIDAGYAGSDKKYSIQLVAAFGGTEVILDTAQISIKTYGSSYVEPIHTDPVYQETTPINLTDIFGGGGSTGTTPETTTPAAGGIMDWINKNKTMVGIAGVLLAVVLLWKPGTKANTPEKVVS